MYLSDRWPLHCWISISAGNIKVSMAFDGPYMFASLSLFDRFRPSNSIARMNSINFDSFRWPNIRLNLPGLSAAVQLFLAGSYIDRSLTERMSFKEELFTYKYGLYRTLFSRFWLIIFLDTRDQKGWSSETTVHISDCVPADTALVFSGSNVRFVQHVCLYIVYWI